MSINNDKKPSDDRLASWLTTPRKRSGASPKLPGSAPIIRNPALGFATLFGLFFIMLIAMSFAVAVITGGEFTVRSFRIMTIFQDLLVFILPALVAAIVVTRLPATFLGLTTKPGFNVTLLALVVMCTSLPAMEAIINLNNSIHLPESMQSIEEYLRSLEDDANGGIAMLMGDSTPINIVISILIVGVLTGLAEELFFRGAFLGLMFSTRMKRHLAVWIAAIVFSAMHFQFFGFIPRMLLGAFFGYLLMWTGSVWVPIIAHAFNNSLVVLVSMLSGSFDNTASEVITSAETQIPTDTLTVLLSVVVTALGIVILRRMALRQRVIS